MSTIGQWVQYTMSTMTYNATMSTINNEDYEYNATMSTMNNVNNATMAQ